MIQTAEANIIAPSVSAEAPVRFLGHKVFVFQDVFRRIGLVAGEQGYQLIGCHAVCNTVGIGIYPLLTCILQLAVRGSLNLFYSAHQR